MILILLEHILAKEQIQVGKSTSILLQPFDNYIFTLKGTEPSSILIRAVGEFPVGISAEGNSLRLTSQQSADVGIILAMKNGTEDLVYTVNNFINKQNVNLTVVELKTIDLGKKKLQLAMYYESQLDLTFDYIPSQGIEKVQFMADADKTHVGLIGFQAFYEQKTYTSENSHMFGKVVTLQGPKQAIKLKAQLALSQYLTIYAVQRVKQHQYLSEWMQDSTNSSKVFDYIFKDDGNQSLKSISLESLKGKADLLLSGDGSKFTKKETVYVGTQEDFVLNSLKEFGSRTLYVRVECKSACRFVIKGQYISRDSNMYPIKLQVKESSLLEDGEVDTYILQDLVYQKPFSLLAILNYQDSATLDASLCNQKYQDCIQLQISSIKLLTLTSYQINYNASACPAFLGTMRKCFLKFQVKSPHKQRYDLIISRNDKIYLYQNTAYIDSLIEQGSKQYQFKAQQSDDYSVSLTVKLGKAAISSEGKIVDRLSFKLNQSETRMFQIICNSYCIYQIFVMPSKQSSMLVKPNSFYQINQLSKDKQVLVKGVGTALSILLVSLDDDIAVYHYEDNPLEGLNQFVFQKIQEFFPFKIVNQQLSVKRYILMLSSGSCLSAPTGKLFTFRQDTVQTRRYCFLFDLEKGDAQFYLGTYSFMGVQTVFSVGQNSQKRVINSEFIMTQCNQVVCHLKIQFNISQETVIRMAVKKTSSLALLDGVPMVFSFQEEANYHFVFNSESTLTISVQQLEGNIEALYFVHEIDDIPKNPALKQLNDQETMLARRFKAVVPSNSYKCQNSICQVSIVLKQTEKQSKGKATIEVSTIHETLLLNTIKEGYLQKNMSHPYKFTKKTSQDVKVLGQGLHSDCLGVIAKLIDKKGKITTTQLNSQLILNRQISKITLNVYSKSQSCAYFVSVQLSNVPYKLIGKEFGHQINITGSHSNFLFINPQVQKFKIFSSLDDLNCIIQVLQTCTLPTDTIQLQKLEEAGYLNIGKSSVSVSKMKSTCPYFLIKIHFQQQFTDTFQMALYLVTQRGQLHLFHDDELFLDLVKGESVNVTFLSRSSGSVLMNALQGKFTTSKDSNKSDQLNFKQYTIEQNSYSQIQVSATTRAIVAVKFITETQKQTLRFGFPTVVQPNSDTVFKIQTNIFYSSITVQVQGKIDPFNYSISFFCKIKDTYCKANISSSLPNVYTLKLEVQATYFIQIINQVNVPLTLHVLDNSQNIIKPQLLYPFELQARNQLVVRMPFSQSVSNIDIQIYECKGTFLAYLSEFNLKEPIFSSVHKMWGRHVIKTTRFSKYPDGSAYLNLLQASLEGFTQIFIKYHQNFQQDHIRGSEKLFLVPYAEKQQLDFKLPELAEGHSLDKINLKIYIDSSQESLQERMSCFKPQNKTYTNFNIQQQVFIQNKLLQDSPYVGLAAEITISRNKEIHSTVIFYKIARHFSLQTNNLSAKQFLSALFMSMQWSLVVVLMLISVLLVYLMGRFLQNRYIVIQEESAQTDHVEMKEVEQIRQAEPANQVNQI